MTFFDQSAVSDLSLFVWAMRCIEIRKVDMLKRFKRLSLATFSHGPFLWGFKWREIGGLESEMTVLGE